MTTGAQSSSYFRRGKTTFSGLNKSDGYTHNHTFAPMRVSVHTCMEMHARLRMCALVCVCTCVCICVSVQENVCMCLCVRA